ncbi:MAG: PDZ domain-containing protein [Lachnospiraceae bacterium]|nr:PDZ domain-containing protein [Lachnospiraceae bacterium]
MIQTDAAINCGNSGGALLNMKGELVGINEVKSAMTSLGTAVDGIAFAIPISKAEPILKELMTLTTREKVSRDHKAYLGVICSDVTNEISQLYKVPTGVCIKCVVQGSPAEKAGVKKGDILSKMDGRNIHNYSNLKEVLQYYTAGEQVEIIVQRISHGKYQETALSLTFGSRDNIIPYNESDISGNDQHSEN